MKKYKIMFWVATAIIVIGEGLVPLLTMNMAEEKADIAQLGYPVYFGFMLAIFKFAGGLALALPMVPKRVKEWAYAGYGIDFISAFVSYIVVTGITGDAFAPLAMMGVLVVSYVGWNKMEQVA